MEFDISCVFERVWGQSDKMRHTLQCRSNVVYEVTRETYRPTTRCDPGHCITALAYSASSATVFFAQLIKLPCLCDTVTHMQS